MAYILSITALVVMTIPSVVKGKNMKIILILLSIGNGLMGTSYLLDGGINGAVSSFIGVVTTAINLCFEVKKLPVPNWLTAIYIAVSVVMNLAVSRGLTVGVALVIIAGVAYKIGVTRKTGSGYRFWIFFNLFVWCIYDIISGSYGVLVTHGAQLVVNVAGMVIHDRKSKSVS